MNPRTGRSVTVTLLIAAILLIVTSTVLAGTVAAAKETPGASGDTVAPECSYPATFTGVDGMDVTLNSPPDRIVSLGPSINQILWEIGAMDEVVGVDSHSLYLDGASKKTNVGKFTYDTSKIVNLTPDVVLAANVTTATGVLGKLRESGLKVYVYGESSSIDNIYRKVRRTGKLSGHCIKASKTVEGMKDTVEKVESVSNGEEDPSVLHLLGSSRFVAGKDTFINSVIETAGGDNIAAKAGITGYKEISSEDLVKYDPAWISLPETVDVPQSSGFGSTVAVRKNQVVHVNDNYISQPAPRVVVPLKKLAKHYHPEGYAEVFGDSVSAGNVSGKTVGGENVSADGDKLKGVSREGGGDEDVQRNGGSGANGSESGSEGKSQPGFMFLTGVTGLSVVIYQRYRSA
ncbi:MAG: helical backbone metal receptor [Halobacteria archaeon]